MRKTDWLVALALALSAAGLVACGGGNGAGSGGGESAADEDAALEFTACMREHGVAMPDPQPGEGGAIDLGDSNLDPDDPATKQALAACNEKLDAVAQDVSPAEDEEFREGALALAQCIREQGIDMGDPEFLGPGKFHLDIAGIDTESPAFEAAREACDGLLPGLSGVTVGG